MLTAAFPTLPYLTNFVATSVRPPDFRLRRALFFAHTHTAPHLKNNIEDDLVQDYIQFVKRKLADAAVFAPADLKQAKMVWAVGNAPKAAFVRRFRMSDGKIRTNPGVGNPDVLEPIRQVDEQVNVLHIDQKVGNSLVMVNFGNHPDAVGGCVISVDWPGFLCRNGAEGFAGIGYFHMQEAHDEGGYEAGSSNLKADIAELIIDKGKKILAELRK